MTNNQKVQIAGNVQPGRNVVSFSKADSTNYRTFDNPTAASLSRLSDLTYKSDYCTRVIIHQTYSVIFIKRKMGGSK